MMTPIKIQSVVEQDGVLRVDGLPFREGDRVEATLTLLNGGGAAAQQAAKKRFIDRACRSSFRSAVPYPTRDQLHERD